MAKSINLDESIAEWQKAIDYIGLDIQKYDKIIAENMAMKKEAQEEMEKYTRWILNAKEMFNLKMDDKKGIKEEPIEAKLFEETKKFSEMSIPEGVAKLLENKSLTVTEVTKQLIEGGFKTSSKKFRNVIQVRLIDLAKRGKVIVEKKGNENYYSLPKS
jgi:hypothetical protein